MFCLANISYISWLNTKGVSQRFYAINYLTHAGPPTAEKLPQRLHVVLGENFQITCTATNDQDAPMNLMFSWKIPNGIQYNVTTSDEDKTRTAFSTLYVSAVTHNHSGMYHCIVKNGEHIRNVNSVTSTVVVEGKTLIHQLAT